MTDKRKVQDTVLDELKKNLEQLRLFAIIHHLDEAIEQACATEQGYVSFLSGLVQKQVLSNQQAGAKRRIKNAEFPTTKTFSQFDWHFQKGLNVQMVKDLTNLQFIKQARPLLLLGCPGTGKTHLSISYGILAANAGYNVKYVSVSKLLASLYATLADGSTDKLINKLSKPDLLICDDLRAIPTKPEYASLLFDLIDARHNKKSTIVSSNLSVKLWGKVLGNVALTASLVDRLMERALVVNIRKGRSYRSDGPESPPEHERPEGLNQQEEQS